jgi:hypothetical protein
MKKRTHGTAPPIPEITGSDRALLTGAYKAGLIVAWRHDPERGVRLTLSDQRDTYVAVSALSSYLDGLRADA